MKRRDSSKLAGCRLQGCRVFTILLVGVFIGACKKDDDAAKLEDEIRQGIKEGHIVVQPPRQAPKEATDLLQSRVADALGNDCEQDPNGIDGIHRRKPDKPSSIPPAPAERRKPNDQTPGSAP